MRDYHIILSVTDGGGILDHLPLAQYRRILKEAPLEKIRRVTLTMPRMTLDGTIHNPAPIDMNLNTFRNGHGFANADIQRWLVHKQWSETKTLLLFKVSFQRGRLDYRLIGKVEEAF